MDKNICLIGVVGQIACGKGELVKYLTEKYGFVSFSLSTIVHQELESRKIKEFDRKILQDIGDELRKKYGRDVLMKRAIKELSPIDSVRKFFPASARLRKMPLDLRAACLPARQVENPEFSATYRAINKFVIEGIRNTAEVEYLKSLPNSTLIGVKAKRELRYKRLLKRAKTWDPKNWDEFVTVDRRDLGVGQKNVGQQVGKCLHYCDVVLTNNDGVPEFRKKIKKIVNKIL